ncbi:hypothetical protein [Nonomuraea sp. 10N515B]|uniref:hypothetical protein n=1 Tax=Nonomuraea sp. 10N515B TaxID=3457422 RepID=UPI003FCD3B28
MTKEMVIAVIAAGAALLGSLLTGGFALLTQRLIRKAAEQKTQQEIQDRDRTRFHEARREVYADFLAAVSDAAGTLSHGAMERQRAAGHPADESAPQLRPLVGQFGPDAPMRMTRQQAIVSMLSGSPKVREASGALVTSVLGFLFVEPSSDHAEWNRALMATFHQQREAYYRFVEAANEELTGLI